MTEGFYETFERAKWHFDLRDPISAAKILEPLRDEQPESRSLLELLGRAYFHSAQLRKAEETFRKLIDLDPCDAWAHIALARSLERQDRDDEAGRYRRLHAAMAGGSRD
ncbi:tetratricopeptide repeat protein [Spiractinospora alimapuensis]|uniref:tetratricopeptide repeat protein n=1 Tax=Spiractinospora alimapuensis TaxID=2820884 RepID=UPI001F2549CB|nr:tetratricopeptide repeat protein [Spiractinospora alimapuensis]QVQ52006.1 tetratricopeptide repeat protein [Spiractinospora alimapuensis]